MVFFSRTSGRRQAARRLRTAIGFRSDDFCGRLVADRRPDVFEGQNALQIMIRRRLVAGRRPDVFERQIALQTIKFSDVWSPAGGQTLSHGELLYKRLRGRLAADRRPNFFERQEVLQTILQTAKLLLF